MINCRALFIHTPFSNEASSVANLLAQKIPDAVYLDANRVVAKQGLSDQQWLVATVMTSTLRACELAHEGKLPIMTFAFREKDWKVILGLCEHAGVTPLCVTLETGKPFPAEYQNQSFSSLSLDSTKESEEKICQRLQTFLEKGQLH
jgi:hypothetical protein